MPENAPARTTPPSAPADTFRDRLLLAFAELEMYGIAARDAGSAEPERLRERISTQLRADAPHGLGSYVFRAGADGARGEVALHTSGAEVDRAVVAACAHQGLAVRPGPRPGVLLVARCASG